MDLPKLGHAVIINNIASEMHGSNEDVKALKESYQTVGFEVQVHENCSVQVSKIVCDCLRLCSLFVVLVDKNVSQRYTGHYWILSTCGQ